MMTAYKEHMSEHIHAHINAYSGEQPPDTTLDKEYAFNIIRNMTLLLAYYYTIV